MFRKRVKDAITLIVAGAEVVGDLSFSGELYVYGNVCDNVAEVNNAARGTICEGGEIRGDVRAANVVVNGRIEVDLFAKSKVEIARKLN